MDFIKLHNTFIELLYKYIGNFYNFTNKILETFPHHVNMSTQLSTAIVEKRNALSLSVPATAKLLNIDKFKLYKWEEGTKPSQFDDYKKLENFIYGKFDQFVKKGKIEADYDYDEAMKKIFPPRPTSDDMGSESLNIAAEEQSDYNADKPSNNILLEYIKAHKRYADAHFELSVAHKKLATSDATYASINADLYKRVINSDFESESPSVAVPNFAGILAVISEIGSGKRFQSKEELDATLHRLYFGQYAKTQ